MPHKHGGFTRFFKQVTGQLPHYMTEDGRLEARIADLERRVRNMRRSLRARRAAAPRGTKP